MQFPGWLQRLICLPTDFTCDICTETMPRTMMFRCKRCSQPYCTTCISEYIDTTFRAPGASAMLPCLTFRCCKFLEPHSCRPIISEETFVLWCDALCKDSIARLPWAYCPSKRCSELVVSECSAFPSRAACPRCKASFCFRCKTTPWHQGYPCDKNGVRKDKDDVLFEKLACKNGWRRCPQCRASVEHVSGCSIMRCRCGHRFCFKCGTTYAAFHKCKVATGEFQSWAG